MDILQTGLACTAERWEWRIGDPDPISWTIVAAYLLAVAAAVRAAAASPQRRERLFWSAAAAVALALALNKQLDLQAFVTDVGACMARIGGWYDMRRPVQAAVFAAIALAGLVASTVALWSLRRALAELWPAFLGLALMGGYVLLRALSLTHVDMLLYHELGPPRLAWLLELPGPLLLAAGARIAAASQRTPAG